MGRIGTHLSFVHFREEELDSHFAFFFSSACTTGKDDVYRSSFDALGGEGRTHQHGLVILDKRVKRGNHL